MKTTRYLTLLIITLLLSSCKGIPYDDLFGSDNDDEETMFVEAHKAECQLYGASTPTLCLQIKVDGDTGWSLINEDEIKNFNYSWGYDYILEVEIDELTQTSDNDPAYEYTLKEQTDIDSASKITPFEISISENPTSSYIQKVSGEDNIYKIFDDKEIECEDDVCDELNDLIDDNKAILMEFQHQGPSEPLKLIDIECSSTHVTFDATCFKADE